MMNMNHRNYCSLLFTTVILFVLIVSCGKNSDKNSDFRKKAEIRIKEIEEAWAQTAVTGDTSVIKKIFADDFIGTDPDGALYSKQDFINYMKADPAAFKSNIVNEIKIRFFGDIAVAQGNETFTRKNNETGRFVWTDVLVQKNGDWQIVAAQDLIAPAVVQNSGKELFDNPSESDIDSIEAGRKAYEIAWMAADANQITKRYTSDALVLYPNRPALKGSEAIRSYFNDFFNEFRQVEFKLKSDEVQISGKWAFDRGSYIWHGIPLAGGNPIKDQGKYLVILQRQTDGSWKVARDMDNSDRPLSQATRGDK